VPAIPPDEDEVIFARRLIAQRCLYGVERNPVAVDLAKVSLWLVTLARDHTLTFVDHALRQGDSLLALSRSRSRPFTGIPTRRLRDDADARASGEGRRTTATHPRRRRDYLRLGAARPVDKAQFELRRVRLFGHLVLAAFFDGEKPREREAKRGEYASAVVSGEGDRFRVRLDEWRHAEQPLAPFHWEIEFPEVFDRERPGLDAFIGNPPFGGKNTLAGANVPSLTN